MTITTDSYIVISDWRERDGAIYLHKAYLAKVGDTICKKKIKANAWYWFEDGKLMSKQEG